jgi:hypothetical protein
MPMVDRLARRPDPPRRLRQQALSWPAVAHYEASIMCRSIQPLHNYDPPSGQEEVRAAAAVQYVRKISGMTRPSCVNEAAFDRAVAAVATATQALLESLVATSPPHDRALDRQRARARWERRRGSGAVAPAD